MANFKPPNHPNSSSLLFFFSLLFTLLSLTVSNNSPMCSPIDSGPIVPTDPLVAFLERLQLTALKTFGNENFDPKLYVDLSLKFSLSETQTAFQHLPISSTGSALRRDLKEFMQNYFNGVEEDLVNLDPPDFVAEPKQFLPGVKNPAVRKWALEVHSLWKNLSRRVAGGVFEHPELHTLIPLPEAIVIPGSRFREVYYWDSYWVIRGLLVSRMYDTAKGVVSNLISLIDEFGFVPNGARRYYINRSQPPLLSAMVYEIYKATGDMVLVRKSLPALLKEHKFWNSGKHSVTVLDAEGFNRTLSRYYAMWDEPRPESATIDMETASKIATASEKRHLYRELSSGAETGWDFSSRWMRNGSDLTTLATTSIIPVDLNAYILQMEHNIAFLAEVTKDCTTAEHFHEAAEARKKAMNSILWNAEMGQWLDYWISNKNTCKDDHTWAASNQNRNVFASNFIPISVVSFSTDLSLVKKVRRSLLGSGLIRAAGIATSLTISGQQWDFPNGWAPIQHLIVEGLARSPSLEAKYTARDIAVRWIRTNYVAYKKSNAMHEKYNVEKCGEFGGGGEYKPQTGFGWSNGVVLAFLDQFGWPEDLKIDCQTYTYIRTPVHK